MLRCWMVPSIERGNISQSCCYIDSQGNSRTVTCAGKKLKNLIFLYVHGFNLVYFCTTFKRTSADQNAAQAVQNTCIHYTQESLSRLWIYPKIHNKNHKPVKGLLSRVAPNQRDSLKTWTCEDVTNGISFLSKDELLDFVQAAVITDPCRHSKNYII